MQQLAGNLFDLGNSFHHVYRNTNGSCLIGNGTGDRLPDPPCRIGGELKALGVVELFYRLQQTQIALLNQIQKLHTSAHVLLGDADNQTQICFGQPLFRIAVALCHTLCQLGFLVRREQRHTADFFQINFNRVVNGDALCGKGHLQIVRHVEVIVVQHVISNRVVYNLNIQLFTAADNGGELIGVEVQFVQYIGDFLGGQFSGCFALFHQCINGHFFLFHSIVPPVYPSGCCFF